MRRGQLLGVRYDSSGRLRVPTRRICEVARRRRCHELAYGTLHGLFRQGPTGVNKVLTLFFRDRPRHEQETCSSGECRVASYEQCWVESSVYYLTSIIYYKLLRYIRGSGLSLRFGLVFHENSR